MIFESKNQKVSSVVNGFISSRRIPHAIMIEGENSGANLELANYIASASVCNSDNAPCGACQNCHLADIDSHPDIAVINPLEGKKFLSVDQIRELRAEAFVKPHQAANRVFIIEDASRMNPQAQNALLKVLEEPPKNVVFILLVPSKTMLLDTIISRCVLLSLLDASTDDQYIQDADKFIDVLLLGSEYELAKLLTPLEKSRIAMEKFLNTLSVRIAERLKSNRLNSRILDSLFDDIKYYLDLLATNINMSLLTSLIASRSKGLLDK